MRGSPQRKPAGNRPETITTIDELVRHLREAGAKRVYLSRENAFQDGVISMIATVEVQRSGNEERDDAESETLTGIIDHYSGEPQNESFEREHVTGVFEALGDSVRFASRAWTVDWTVRSAYRDPPAEFTTLYDRGVEYKHGDGFNVRNALFAYERYCERDSLPSERATATSRVDPPDPSNSYW